jgi:hypothetical protein
VHSHIPFRQRQLSIGWRQWCRCGLSRDVDVEPFSSAGPWRRLSPKNERLDHALELLREAQANKRGWLDRVGAFLRDEG